MVGQVRPWKLDMHVHSQFSFDYSLGLIPSGLKSPQLAAVGNLYPDCIL